MTSCGLRFISSSTRIPETPRPAGALLHGTEASCHYRDIEMKANDASLSRLVHSPAPIWTSLSTTRSFLLSFLLGVIPLSGSPQPYCQQGAQPLPELTYFVQEVRKNLRSDRLLLSNYTYLEKDTELRLDSNGNAVKTEVKVYEVYPALEQALTYRKLVSKNGKPLPRDELERQDRDYEAKIQGRARQGQAEGSDARKRRTAEAEARRKEEEAIDEVFRLYQILMVGRETLSGKPAIVLEFKPRPGFLPKTNTGKILKGMEGRAWIDEQDRQLVRVDARLINTI